LRKLSCLHGEVFLEDPYGHRTQRRVDNALWSQRTVYVQPLWAFWIQLHIEDGALLLPLPSDQLLLVWSNGHRVSFDQILEPSRGLHPVESFPDRAYVGQAIVRIEVSLVGGTP
jgi:hypothetical protein